MKATIKKTGRSKVKVTIYVSISVSVFVALYVIVRLFGEGNSGLETTSSEINSITETDVSMNEYETNLDKTVLQNNIEEKQITDTSFNDFSKEDIEDEIFNKKGQNKGKLLLNTTVDEFVLRLDGKEKQIQDTIGTRSEDVLKYTIEESKSINNNQIVIAMSSPDKIYNYLNIIKPIANRTNNPILFVFMGDGFFKLHKEFKEINQGEPNDYLDNSESCFKNALYFSNEVNISNNICAYLSNVYAERHRIMHKENNTDEEIEVLLTIIAYGNISLDNGGGNIDTTLQSIPKYNIAYSYYHLYMMTDESNVLLKEYFYNQSKDNYNEINLSSPYFVQARNDLNNLEESHN